MGGDRSSVVAATPSSAGSFQQINDFRGRASLAQSWKYSRDAVEMSVGVRVGHRVDRKGDVEPALMGVANCRLHAHAGRDAGDHDLGYALGPQMVIEVRVRECAPGPLRHRVILRPTVQLRSEMREIRRKFAAPMTPLRPTRRSAGDGDKDDRQAATMGRLADVFGPRRVYLVSLLLVALAGVLGQLAPTLSSLVVARVVLGIGTSGAYPSAMRICRTQADRLGCEPPRVAMSFLSLAAQSTSAVGSLLGGVLTEVFGWHSIFTVNILLAIVAAVLVLLWTPKDPPRPVPFAELIRKIDLIGIVLFSALLLNLMIFLMNLMHPIWWALLAAAVLGAPFVAQSMRREQPFIDIRMLVRNGPLAITYLRTSLLMMIVYCIIYGFAQWRESGAGFTSSQAGLMMIPVSVVAAVSSVGGARSKGIRAPIIVSIASALIGCICLLGIDGKTIALSRRTEAWRNPGRSEADLHSTSGSVPGVHIRLYLYLQTSPGGGRHEAPLPRDPTLGPSDVITLERLGFISPQRARLPPLATEQWDCHHRRHGQTQPKPSRAGTAQRSRARLTGGSVMSSTSGCPLIRGATHGLNKHA